MTPQESFNKFRAERIRESGQGYFLLAQEKTPLKEIFKAYNRWLCDEKTAKKIALESFTLLCEEAFGDSRGKKEYLHLRVFLDEDDLEEFEKEHTSDYRVESAILNPNPIVNPCTDAVPSLKMANYILNSENKVELVRGLIEDKRALSFEIDELEKKIEALEQYQRGSINFINHLLKKMENPPR